MQVSYIHTLSMWVAARSVLNGQIDCQNMSWLHCFESCDHFQDPTRRGDADVVCVTSTMSAVEDTQRWRGATFLFHQLGKMKLQATSISYTVATGQKFMVWCWNARMVIRHIDYICYFTKVIKSTIGFHYAYSRLVVILEMFDSEGSYWIRNSHQQMVDFSLKTYGFQAEAQPWSPIRSCCGCWSGNWWCFDT